MLYVEDGSSVLILSAATSALTSLSSDYLSRRSTSMVCLISNDHVSVAPSQLRTFYLCVIFCPISKSCVRERLCLRYNILFTLISRLILICEFLVFIMYLNHTVFCCVFTVHFCLSCISVNLAIVYQLQYSILVVGLHPLDQQQTLL